MSFDKERYATDPEYRKKVNAACRKWHAANRSEINARRREKRASNPEDAEAIRRGWLWRKYGLTPEDFDAMVARQDGLCALCRRRPTERLNVDHSHDTEMLRLLLCRTCNTGLGCFGDDPALMRDGADYLEIWQIIHARRRAVAASLLPKKNTSKPKKKEKPCPRTSSPTKRTKPRS